MHRCSDGVGNCNCTLSRPPHTDTHYHSSCCRHSTAYITNRTKVSHRFQILPKKGQVLAKSRPEVSSFLDCCVLNISLVNVFVYCLIVPLYCEAQCCFMLLKAVHFTCCVFSEAWKLAITTDCVCCTAASCSVTKLLKCIVPMKQEELSSPQSLTA